MNNSAFVPERSQAGLAAQDVFYRGFNDVNFYVEDADQENLYLKILKNHFPDLKIQKIFPLGGKEGVFKHLADRSNQESESINVYLVDKDFDDFLNGVKKVDNLFYLDRYCIENYLLEIDALVEVVVETFPKISKRDIKDKLRLDKKLDGIYADLSYLFAMFFCVQFFDLNLKNCASKPEQFCKPKRLWEIDPDALSNYWKELLELCSQKGISPPLLNPLTDTRTSQIAGCDAHRIISGKFVLAMIFHYIKYNYSLGSITFDSFVYRVAKNSSFNSLDGLAKKMKDYIALTQKKRRRRKKESN